MARVLILYNEPVLPKGHPEYESEAEVLYTVDHVATALSDAGHAIERLGLGDDPIHFVRDLKACRADVVFNLFEGLPNVAESESSVAGLLEWLGLPFTGSPSRALTLARDKPLSKMILDGVGLPTAGFVTLSDANDPRLSFGPGDLKAETSDRPLNWPLIIKLADEDASVGIEQASVVTDLSHFQARALHMLERFSSRVIVEEYIAGRELTVGVIETGSGSRIDKAAPLHVWRAASGAKRALPVSEFEFKATEGYWPIVTYDAKWNTLSRDFEQTPYRELADVSPELAHRLGVLALRAFEVLGLRDYGRIDFRVTPDGHPFILEANPNPDISPMAGLFGVLEAVGLTYSDLVVGLVEQALARTRKGGGNLP